MEIKKYPVGYVPGVEFVDGGAPYGLKVGIITRVDEIELVCDVKILTGGGDRYEIDLTQGQAGPRSFWGGIPEVNSVVIIGYRRKHKQLHEAIILGYIPTGKRSSIRFDPFASDDPNNISPDESEFYNKVFGSQIRYKRLDLKSGDVGGMSAKGAEMVLSADVRLTNRAGDGIELRDSERSLVQQSIHRVESEAGILRVSGPLRRSAYYLPPDIFSEGTTLKTTGYYGADELQRFMADPGTLLDSFNAYSTNPPVTYSNGRQVYYPSTIPGVSFEDPDSGGGDPFTEDRLEMTHTTDMTQEVREEIDGFQVDRKPIFIERVMGTLVGNDTSSETGMQQYGQLLRPKLFDEFLSTSPGSFSTVPILRSPLDDSESYTTAGAYLFRISPPSIPSGTNPTTSAFAASVSKQGKLFVNIPGSRVENYSTGTKNVSAEINMEGALKMRLGAAKPDNIALHLTLEGGAVFDFRGATSGAGLMFRTHSSYVVEARGVPDQNNVAYSENLQGNRMAFCSADSTEGVNGAKITTVSGGYSVVSDRFSVNAQNGLGLNAGSLDMVISGKSQYRFAQDVVETIVTGGKSTTVLQGGVSETLTVGDKSIDLLGGSMKTTVVAGSYEVSVGTGSVQISSTAGSVTLSSTANSVTLSSGLAMSMTAGTSMTLSASTGITLSAPQVFIGSAAASLGVSRGSPMLPPNSPSLDWITGAPLQGCAVIRSQ